MVLEVYGDPVSGVCRAVYAFLALNKIAYESKNISLKDGEQKKPEFLAINPQGYVPTIVDDGLMVCETAAILQYLAASRGLEDPWFPAEPKKRALIYRYAAWHHANLRKYGQSQPLFKIIGPQRGLKIPPQVIAECDAKFPEVLDIMEAWIENQGYIAGDTMTISDLIAFYDLQHCVELCNKNITTYQNLYKWYRKISAMPELADVSKPFFGLAKMLNSKVKLWGNPMSSPSRAVESFLKLAKIPYEFKLIDMMKGEGHQEPYKTVNPLGLIPGIEVGEFKLAESGAIMNFLADYYSVDDHWYPKDAVKRVKVQQVMNWYHLNLRKVITANTYNKVLVPMKGLPAKTYKLAVAQACVNPMGKAGTWATMEHWLTSQEYLAGDEISIADLMTYSEIFYAGYMDLDFAEHTKLVAWFAKVGEIPEVVEVHAAAKAMFDKRAADLASKAAESANKS